ncbi:MAG: aminoacetone oxidase family FAD-binding enzyme [Eubacterium sp.]|nr:aminoacetone oxidase family FAD-binding enzyme [Eubacterium sp.]
MKVIVIGGGASGLFAAIHAARMGASVTIIEQDKKTGKKLSVTGNGKCNFTNYNLIAENTKDDLEQYYYGDYELIRSVFHQFDAKDAVSFFEQIGVCSYVEKNYNGLYPKSNQASSVTQALTDYARELKIKIKTNNFISGIFKTDQGFSVDVGIPLQCDRLIVATGGYLPDGDGMSGYEIAKSFGHTIHSLKPALTALIGKSGLNSAAGVRIPAKISKETGESQTGELQITDYGISGIPVFNLSHLVQDGERLWIDFFPEYQTMDSFRNYIKSVYDNLKQYRMSATLGQALVGLFPAKLLTVVLKETQLSEKTIISELSEEAFASVFELLKAYPFQVKSRRDFSYAQVTQGGIPGEEIHSCSMESKRCSGLYFVGEILDVDGICGGYNLQWAWSTGYIAGVNSSK